MQSDDLLTRVFRSVRLTGAVQFRIVARGPWRTGTGSMMRRFGLVRGRAVPFHIIAGGACWLDAPGGRQQLGPGDIVAFPFAAPHDLGQGAGGFVIDPECDLPPAPWSTMPTLDRGEGDIETRILCGFFLCPAFGFAPLSASVPEVLVARASHGSGGWLAAAAAQIDREVAAGPSPLAERLIEAMFLDMLRQHLDTGDPAVTGWLGAAADPVVGRCLAALHADPAADWSLDRMAAAANASVTVLSDRFARLLGQPPMRYLRRWRLHLAACAIADGSASIAEAAHSAGYNSDAAFTRAFAAEYGAPPARWRMAAIDRQRVTT